MRSPGRASAAVAAFAGLLVLASGTLLGEGGWQSETRLTNNPDTSTVGPNNGKYLAVDPAGNLHIVWVDYRDKTPRVFHKKMSGGIWSADEPVTAKGGTPARPVIVFDESGMMHLLWNDDRTGNMEIYHKVWHGGWDEDVQVTQTAGASFGSSIVAVGDTIHLVYMERIDGHLQIMYRRCIDFVWSPAYPLTDVPTGDRMVPTLAKGRDGSLHAAWWDTRNDPLVGKIYYREKIGDIWLDEVLLTDPANDAMRPSIAVDDSLGVHIAWIDARGVYEQIYYRHRAASGWESEVALTHEPATHYHPSLSTAGGTVYLAYWDNHVSETNSEVFFLEKTALAWSGPLRVSNSDGASTLCCLIAEPNKNLHVAWVDTRDGNPEMYYRGYIDPSNGVGDDESAPPAAGILARIEAHPNPFHGSTSVEVDAGAASAVSVRIYSVDGRCVRTLVDERLLEGTHRFEWNGTDDRGRPLAPGAYFALGRFGKTRVNEKIVLLR